MRLQKMSDEEIHPNALDDPANPPLTEEQLGEFVRIRDIPGSTLMEKFRNLRDRKYKQPVSIRYDTDVLEYFKAKGKGYQTIMNDALRAFMEAEMAEVSQSGAQKGNH